MRGWSDIMTDRRISARGALCLAGGSVLLASMLWSAGGCQPNARTETAQTSATTGEGRDAQADAIAASDTERGMAAIRENHESRARRPATRDDRAGARVVD